MISLKELLENHENENIEFKESFIKLSKDFWPTYSAFANTAGGYIVLGIAEPVPYQYEVSGVKNHKKLLDDLFNTAANKDKVNHNQLNKNNIEIFEDDGKVVISIYIAELPVNQKPLYLNKNISNTYIRKNTGDYLATEEEIRRFMRNASDNIDGELLDGYTIEDLDIESILAFKNIVHLRKPEGRYLAMDNSEFLKSMGLFRIDRNDGRKWKLTLAGLLFLGTEEAILSRIPHFHLDYLNKRGNNARWSDRVSSGDLNYQNLNIFKFYSIVLNKLFLTIREPFELDKKAIRKSSAELEIIIREALVNMLVHADYLDSETAIRAEVHDFFYTFTNPGTMKIPQEQFFVGGHSEPRNNTLITFFKKMGASEKEGGGGREIFTITQNNRFRIPELDVTLKSTFLKIWLASPEDSYPDFSEKTRTVFLYIKENYSVKMKEIEKNTKISYHFVRKALQELLDLDLIEMTGKGKATKYTWKPSKIERFAAVESIKNAIMKN